MNRSKQERERRGCGYRCLLAAYKSNGGISLWQLFARAPATQYELLAVIPYLYGRYFIIQIKVTEKMYIMYYLVLPYYPLPLINMLYLCMFIFQLDGINWFQMENRYKTSQLARLRHGGSHHYKAQECEVIEVDMCVSTLNKPRKSINLNLN